MEVVNIFVSILWDIFDVNVLGEWNMVKTSSPVSVKYIFDIKIKKKIFFIILFFHEFICSLIYFYIDIDECLANNGRGPCQDVCKNFEGGYSCSCESLPGTVLNSSDNHTCQDVSPCSVDNAGCSHTCLATAGRVFCLCPDGFVLQDDWKTCQGIHFISIHKERKFIFPSWIFKSILFL